MRQECCQAEMDEESGICLKRADLIYWQGVHGKEDYSISHIWPCIGQQLGYMLTAAMVQLMHACMWASVPSARPASIFCTDLDGDSGHGHVTP